MSVEVAACRDGSGFTCHRRFQEWVGLDFSKRCGVEKQTGHKKAYFSGYKGIPLSVVMSSASTHDIKMVTDVMDNIIIKRSSSLTKHNLYRIRKLQHL